MNDNSIKKTLKATWYFIWKDDSLASWLVNIVLAIIIVKFLLYPGIGLALATDFPLVAVVSSSMEHNPNNFNQWWDSNKDWYLQNNINKEQFEDYSFRNGFNKGDIMILTGRSKLKKGDILVYQSSQYPNPIIHRIISIETNSNIKYHTKGDNNLQPDPTEILQPQIQNTGKAIFRVPYLGWIKIVFTDLINLSRR